jgi:EAL domain-containing protein (putative c-di-GMP-specific phosphodiesterase class I)
VRTVAPLGSRIQRLLDVARGNIGMEVAWFTELVDDHQVIRAASGDLGRFGLEIGDAIPLDESYCAGVLRGEVPRAVPDARRDLRTRDLAITHDLGIGSYVGHPISTGGGEPVGMVCCLSQVPTPGLDGRASDLLGALLAVLGGDIPSWSDRPGRDLKRAMTRKHLAPGGMRTVYQPVVRISDGQVIGYEALTRFADPAGSDPARAFREAAIAGLGTELEVAAVALALAGRAALPADLWLSVNLSPAAVLSDAALELLATHQDSNLIVEITEHARVDDYAALAARTAQLRSFGIEIAVDDAGAGYASFRHIMRLRPHLIKLDIEITHGIHLDPIRQALAHTLVVFAWKTGATLLAEGVENQREAETLQSLGVDIAQGYLFGRPAPLPAS